MCDLMEANVKETTNQRTTNTQYAQLKRNYNIEPLNRVQAQ